MQRQPCGLSQWKRTGGCSTTSLGNGESPSQDSLRGNLEHELSARFFELPFRGTGMLDDELELQKAGGWKFVDGEHHLRVLHSLGKGYPTLSDRILLGVGTKARGIAGLPDIPGEKRGRAAESLYSPLSRRDLPARHGRIKPHARDVETLHVL